VLASSRARPLPQGYPQPLGLRRGRHRKNTQKKPRHMAGVFV